MRILICFVFFQFTLHSQIVAYQDIFQGGVTAAGYSIGASTGQQSFATNLDVDIPVGSTIRKAIIVVSEDREVPKSIVFNLNGDNYSLDQTTKLVGYDITTSGGNPYQISNHIIDVSNSIFVGQNSYLLSIPNQNAVADVYRSFYLIILFDSPSVINTSFSLFMNNLDIPDLTANWTLREFASYDIGYDIGLAINSDIVCQIIDDGEYVFLNETPIGLIGGSDQSNVFMCAGVKAHFNYDNGILMGLDDDIPNNSMSESDGLAVINGFVGANDDTIAIRFESQRSNYRIHNNPISFQLTYTTPCDTFSVSTPNDTTLCYGETLQLNVSVPSAGPQTAYEWTTSTGSAPNGLSCSDCPDPIFTADSSMFYTVRIWNNDSCSVVRPLKINVNRTQIDSLDISHPDCGASNGSIVVYAHNSLNETLNYSLNGTSTGSATVGLAEGSYTISVQDAMGCPVVDSTIVLNAVNNTVSQFALNPTVGNVPLEIDVYNQSQNATEYEWYINGSYVGDNLGGYTIEDGGEYVFELVAWQYDPSCADTFSLIVWASEVIIPTAFTPNNDGDNDVWEIVNLDAHYPKNTVKVFNRWGNLLYESKEGDYAMNPWNGTYNGEPVPVGSYYFIIETHTKGVDDFKGIVTVIRE